MLEVSNSKADSQLSHHTPMMTGLCPSVQPKPLQGALLSESAKLLHYFKTRHNRH